MRMKIDNRSLNCAAKTKISSDAEQSICAQTENQRQDLTMDETINKGTEMIEYDKMTKIDNDDNMYLLISESKKSSDETPLDECKNTQYNEIHIFAKNNENEHKENEVDSAIAETLPEANKTASSRRKRRSSRLLANDKKENLKKTGNSGNIVKQKTTRKSNRIKRSTKSDATLMMLYKEFETEGHSKSLPSFACINHNNDTAFDKSMPYYGAVNQEEVNQYGLNNRNTLQYLDYNHLNHQVNFMNSNPWSIASRNGQNMNNITNVPNNVGQRSFVNDWQYYDTVDYNWKQNENPYMYSSVNSMDPYKLLPMENKDYCWCSICTNYMRNSLYPAMEKSRTSATFQPMVNNITSSTNSSTAISNNLLNASVDPFNPFCNYQQQLQTDYGSKKLFYKTLNTVNHANNSGCEVTSIVKENLIPPLNNWHHINRLTYNNNLNIPLNTSIMSDVLSSSSIYANNSNAQLNNYYNRNIVGANVSMGQYSEKNHFHPYTLTLENSLPDTHGLDSDKLMNTLSQNSTGATTDSSMTTNFLPETDTVDVTEGTPSGIDAKKKDWFSDVFNNIYKDTF